MMRIRLLLGILFLLSLNGCEEADEEVVIDPNANYLTENVIILSIDGIRMLDSWNSSTTEDRIPFQRNLTEEGVFFNQFYNNGETYTVPGHAAICTGTYDQVENGGKELPSNPSIFQRFLKHTYFPPSKSWIIAGKEKLNVLANTKNLNWINSFTPKLDAEDRADSVTLRKAIEILRRDQPVLSMIHFKGPDQYGHQDNWEKYIGSIVETDNYANQVWEFIQENNYYKNRTTLFITSDHGRHLDQIDDGFIGHGDRCVGCRHIYLLALGPDFDKNKVIDRHYSQIDIAPTIATLLNFEWEGEGNPIIELTQ